MSAEYQAHLRTMGCNPDALDRWSRFDLRQVNRWCLGECTGLSEWDLSIHSQWPRPVSVLSRFAPPRSQFDDAEFLRQRERVAWTSRVHGSRDEQGDTVEYHPFIDGVES